MSAGNSSTGMRLTVASAAPVSMLAAPGPTEAVTAKVSKPVLLPGIADGDVHHGLLVAALVVRQEAGFVELGLQQRLADAGHVAVPEDAEAAGEELTPHAVSLGILLAQELHDRLADGQPHHRRRSRGVSHTVSPSEVV